MPIDRARVATILPRLGLGAVLGALSMLAADELGFPGAVHLSAYRLMPAAVGIAALLALTRARAVLWVIAGSLAALIAAVAFTPLVAGPVRAKIRADRPMPVDAIVILASGLTSDALLSWDAVDRVLSGFDVARDSAFTRGARAPVVMTPVTFEGVSSVPDQRRFVSSLSTGAPVFLTPLVYSTRDEALQVKRIAALQGWRRVAVVTSPVHTRRACRTFERAGLAVTCVPARTRAFSSRLTSPGDRIAAFRWWLYETAGTTLYRIRGWI